ncbi:MAG: efflux RND transporter permease subunit [Verrucomicrobiota bacterium]
MKTMIGWFIRNPVASNLLMGAIIMSGLLSLARMKIEIFPETALDTVNVSVDYPGSTPYEVEEGICIPIEEAIQDLEGIKKITSKAREGGGYATVEVESGHKVRDVLDDIKVRVDAITTFPEDAEKPVIEELTIKNQVLSLAVSGDTDEKTLRLLVEQVRDELLAYEYIPEKKDFLGNLLAILRGTPKITQVEMASVRPYEISIEVSEADLRKYGLTFDEVAQAISRSSLDIPGGAIKTSAGEILLRTEGQAYWGEEFSDLVLISRADGSRIVLGDIAQVKDAFEENSLKGAFDGERAALVSVFRVGGQSALDIDRLVHAYVEDFRPKLPEGIKLEIWKNDSIYLQQRIELLLRNAAQGLVLVFICLALFLRMNVAIWVTLGIPISFLGAFSVMALMGVSINMISLFSMILVLGIIVDDAIVVGENVYTHSQKYGSGLHSALSGTMQVTVPVIFAILTTIAAFAPMLNIPGVAGKIWGVIPMTVIPALVFSMLESKLILPSHLSHLKTERSDKPLRGLSGLWRWIRRHFAQGLNLFIRHIYRRIVFISTEFRYVTVAVFVALLFLSVGMVQSGWLKFVFFPRVPADFVIARLEFPIGTSFQVTEKAIKKIENAALVLRDEVENDSDAPVFSHVLATTGSQPFVGAFDLKMDQAQSHVGEVTVELTPANKRNVTSGYIEKRWRELTGVIPGAIELSFTSKLQDVGEPINIQIIGRDFEKLKSISAQLKKKLEEYTGVYDISDNFRSGKKEIKLDILPSAESLGLTLSDLGRQVRQAFYGAEAQRIQRGRDEVKVMVRYPYEERKSVVDLDNLRIRDGQGNEIPFAQVADARVGRGFSTITRVDLQRAINITADVDQTQGNAQEILSNLENDFLKDVIAENPGVYYSLEGQSREQKETIGGLLVGALYAIFAIYALMAIPFKSYIKPAIIMSVIPFSITGVAAGHIIMGMPISMLSVCGMIALTGVVVNDGLVLIDYINQNQWKGLPLGLSVRRAGVARFRAILLTSLTTFVGLMPLLSETSTQAQFLKPMAVSLAYGVLFATLLNLVLVPCFYMILQDILKSLRRLFGIDKPSARVA